MHPTFCTLFDVYILQDVTCYMFRGILHQWQMMEPLFCPPRKTAFEISHFMCRSICLLYKKRGFSHFMCRSICLSYKKRSEPPVPTQSEPMPSAPTPCEPTPSVPTPSEPTPSAPTPSEPTPSVQLQQSQRRQHRLHPSPLY
jgi:hypothetical protein